MLRVQALQTAFMCTWQRTSNFFFSCHRDIRHPAGGQTTHHRTILRPTANRVPPVLQLGASCTMHPRHRCQPEELIEILRIVNPANEAGRVTLITRMSSKHLEDHLPKLISAVQEAGLNVSAQTPSIGHDPEHEHSLLARLIAQGSYRVPQALVM